MSPEERCAYLCQQHEQFKDSLLQVEPHVFRYIVNRFPLHFDDYTRTRQFFDGLPVAAAASRRFFTFQDATNYSTLGAPWIGIKMAGSKAYQIAALEKILSSGAAIDRNGLTGAHGADWQIVTTDPALIQAFRQFSFRGIVRERDDVFRAYAPERPIVHAIEQIRAFIMRFQGEFAVNRVMAYARLGDELRQLADMTAGHRLLLRDAWI